MNEPAVVLDGVSVHYGRHQALRDITATLPTGAIGLLGPNGAGKSTLIKTLLGIVAPSSGRMRVLGYDVRESPLAKSVTSCPSATSSSVSQCTTRSVPP